jgi:hypothetical protein
LLAKDPDQRPHTDELEAMLSDALLEPPAVAPPAPQPANGYGVRYPEGEHAQALPFLLTPQAGEEDSPRRRSWAPVAMVLSAVLLLAGIAAVAVVNALDDPAGRTSQGESPRNQRTTEQPGGGEQPSKSPSVKRTASSTAPSSPRPTPSTPTRSPSPSTATTGPPPTSQAPLPAGFVQHRDPTGFRVAVPEGWTERRSGGSYVDFLDPQTGGFLRIDQTTTPQSDPVADWQRQEPSVAARLPGYERIRIEAVDYRGWNTADWEFTWQGSSGRVHVLDRGFVTGDKRGYALYWSMPESAWESRLDEFATVAATFRPAG